MLVCPICRDAKGKPLEGTLYKQLNVNDSGYDLITCISCSYCQPIPHHSKGLEDVPTIQSLKQDWQ